MNQTDLLSPEQNCNLAPETAIALFSHILLLGHFGIAQDFSRAGMDLHPETDTTICSM